MGSRSFKYAPLLVFGVVYALSCLVGALLLMVEWEPFVALFEYFSGTATPQLSAQETRTNILLLTAAPLALAAGYVLGAQVRFDRVDRPRSRPDDGGPARWLPPVVFAVLALVGLVSLVRAGALGRATTWLEYGAWVESRSENFARLSFLEFVNLYVLVPVAAAWVLVSDRSRTRLETALRWVPTPIALALSLLLFTRKSILTALLIVMFAWVIHAVRTRSRNVGRFVLGGVAMLTGAYIALVVIPVYAESASTAAQATALAKLSTDPERAARLSRMAESLDLADRRRAILLYAALSPLTRSSAPALAYPVVFPRRHDYFRLDVGLDIAGIGAMPNDNVVVWNHLNPTMPGGTTTVSYQFVLYSQIGTLGAIVASLLVGLLLAILWRLSQLPGRASSALLGSMVLLLATYLAIDSLRNSLLVSYGVMWGAAFVAAATVLARVAEVNVSRRCRRTSRSESAAARRADRPHGDRTA